MRATYTGITPDTFVNDSEVVLTGTLAPDGFHATSMTAVPIEVRPQAVGTTGPTGPTATERGRWHPSGATFFSQAFVVCACALAASIAGARRRSRRLIESGIGAFYLVAAIMSAVSAIIVYAFVSGDYSIKYVARIRFRSATLLQDPSYWGGLDGSIMFWVFLLSIFGSTAVYVNRERHRELIPYVVAVISVVEMFFLFLMVVHNNPFQTYLTESPTEGQGLNPLLQNFYMVIHPPTMYLGFVGLTIPFAGLAALITGFLDDSWLRAVRRWTMISWLFLSVGLGLGMIWA